MNQEEINKKIDVFTKGLPKGMKKLDEDTIKYLEGVITKEELWDEVVTYQKVLEDGKWSVKQYLNAIRFITYQAMGYTNAESYLKVFPDKFGVPGLDKYVNKFNKSILVTKIRSIVPIAPHLLHMDLNREALMVSTDLMRSAKSEKVKLEAAKLILEYTKPPEDNHLSIDVNIKKDTTTQDLEATLMKLAQEQVKAIESGSISNKQVAEMDIITVEPEDAE